MDTPNHLAVLRGKTSYLLPFALVLIGPLLSVGCQASRSGETPAMPNCCGPTPAEEAVYASLRQPIDVDMTEVPLTDAIEFLRKTTGANFYPNWPALMNNAGIERDSPITLKANGVPGDQILDLILTQASASAGDLDPIGWHVRDRIVYVSTRSDLNGLPITCGYDISFQLRQWGLNWRATSSAIVELCPAPRSDFAEDQEHEPKPGIDVSLDEVIQEIAEKMIESIAENAGEWNQWAHSGGDVSSARLEAGALVIRAPAAVHREVPAAIDAIRFGYDRPAKKLYERMRSSLTAVRLKNAKLADAIETLQRQHNIDIFMNWRTLAHVGVTRETVVDVNLNHVDLWTLIDLIAEASGEGVAVSLRGGLVRFNGIRLVQ